MICVLNPTIKMSTTPSKTVLPLQIFSPNETTSPHKDTHGISKTVFTHVSNLHSLLNDWVRVTEKGTKICRSITALKLHEFGDGYYPQVLKPLMESLGEALDSLEHIVEGVETIDKQLQALARLETTDQPVIFTWSARQISDNVSNICQSLQKEYRLKQIITENLAHCRDENLIEVYVSSWEFDTYIDINSNAYLFAEVGLPGIT